MEADLLSQQQKKQELLVYVKNLNQRLDKIVQKQVRQNDKDREKNIKDGWINDDTMEPLYRLKLLSLDSKTHLDQTLTGRQRKEVVELQKEREAYKLNKRWENNKLKQI